MACGAVLAILGLLWLAGAEKFQEEHEQRFRFCSWKCITFVQMWPGSFCVPPYPVLLPLQGESGTATCKVWQEHPKGTKPAGALCQALAPRFDCVIPESADSWTIHGLWPSNIMNCCSCWNLFPSDLMDLPQQLAQHWPTFLNSSSFTFWRQEWQKHGTCAACMEALSSPSKYFGAALTLRTTYNIDGAFQQAGIIPSCNHSYQLHTLQEALVPVMGKEYELQCVTDGQARQVLVQLKVSLFSNFSAGCLEEGTQNFSPYRPCENQRRIFYFPLNQKNPRDPCP